MSGNPFPAADCASPKYTVPGWGAATIGPRRLLMILLLAALLAGCAARQPAPPSLPADEERLSACLAYFERLDDQIEEEGIRDGAGKPVAGLPWLRSSRFIAARASALSDRDLLDALRSHDRDARLLELANLSASGRQVLMVADGDHDPEARMDQCGRELTEALLQGEAPDREALQARIAVPDDYISWHRWAGLYPVTRWGIRAGVGVWQRGTRAEFETEPPATPMPLRYEPVPVPESITPEAATALLRRAPRDALDRAVLSRLEQDVLLAAFAPVVELERDAGHNRIGTPVWQRPGRPTVNISQPRVYGDVAQTRFAGATVTQLQYVFWFSSRPKSNPLDLLGGRLDGMTLRITLDAEGRPMLLESMHNCGCYHQHYPLQGLVARQAPDYAEPPLVLDSAGPPTGQKRLTVTLRDRSHYLRRVYLSEPSQGRPGPAQEYLLSDYDELRSLPAEEGRRSLFESDGLVAGTERDERVLFWISGVPSPGAMRQLGRHPTAFVGRRHFDDPDLLDRVFLSPVDSGE